MTRVGLLGYGIAGRVFHAPLISSTEGMDLVAVVTANPERQAQARAAYPDTAIATADELFEMDLDLIVVGTPNRTHADYARKAIDKGVAVVVDKPFAPTSAEAKELVASARAKGVPLTVFQNRRWDSDFLTVRKVTSSTRRCSSSGRSGMCTRSWTCAAPACGSTTTCSWR